jgi:CubicO group peptidase (beta-lactamase class C family)
VESNVRTRSNPADLLRTTVGDYAKFVISVMHNEGVSQEIASQRSVIKWNEVKPEEEAVLCESASNPEACSVVAGMGLGWKITKINGETILDHSGTDPAVHTRAFFLPDKQMGAVIFTNGDNGTDVIARIIAVLYPNPVYRAAIEW